MKDSFIVENGLIVASNEPIKKLLYVSNNDACEKNIAFYFEDEKDILLDGRGGKLLLSSDTTGFVFKNCENITVKNLNVDYSNNNHFELKVRRVKGKKIYVEYRDGFVISLKENQILFKGAKEIPIKEGLMLPYDESLARPDYRTGMYCFGFENPPEGMIAFDFTIHEDAEGQFIICEDNLIKKGQVLVFMTFPRHNQAFVLEDCKNVKFENINIEYSPSMGIVAQTCENLSFEHVVVKRNGKHGLISTVADATHFINCSGKIEIKDCEFFNMLDDAGNFHGIYTQVSNIDDNVITVEIKHHQQYGVNIYKVGDIVDVYLGKTLQLRKHITVLSSKVICPSCLQLVVDDASNIKMGDIIENSARMPEVYVSNCKCGDNRPRAFLLTTPKKVVVENCEFSTCAHAIDISGDVSYWFESGRCSDVTIRNNVFNVCNYNEIDYAIWIRPDFDTAKGKNYHSNILIQDNLFIGITDGILQARFVSGLTLKNNKFRYSDLYPFIKTKNGMYFIEDCENVKFL